jgi:hypothetical protein
VEGAVGAEAVTEADGAAEAFMAAEVGVVTVAAVGVVTLGAVTVALGVVTLGLAKIGTVTAGTVAGLTVAGLTVAGLTVAGLTVAGSTMIVFSFPVSVFMDTRGGGVGATLIILIIRTPTTVTVRIMVIRTMAIQTTRTVIPVLRPPSGSKPHSPGAAIIAARLTAQ